MFYLLWLAAWALLMTWFTFYDYVRKSDTPWILNFIVAGVMGFACTGYFMLTVTR